MPIKDLDARRKYMREYQRKYMPAWRRDNPEATRAIDARRNAVIRESGLRHNQVGAIRRHKISEADYVSMVTVHPGCAICNKLPPEGKRWSVDHDHKTGRVRGLLCFNCNSGIAHFKDNPAALRAAIEYLE